MSPIKTLAVIALSLVANHALADWVEIGSNKAGGINNDSGVTMYYDHSKTSSLGYTKDRKKAFILQSYDKKQPLDKGVKFSSSVTRMEIDCLNQKYQFVAFFFYSEPMAKGDIVQSANEPPQNGWSYPAPNSAMETVVEKSCKR